MKVVGTGVDITEVRRLRQAVERWGDVFLGRLFTNDELNNSRTRASLYQHLAGRFAAKEAVFKAFNDGSLNWKDVEILNDKEGRPCCRILNGKAGNKTVYVSISHVKSYAVANAFVVQES
jgi:holo-[acyl-carrier protein] synthase